jgi:hypothetical protein
MSSKLLDLPNEIWLNILSNLRSENKSGFRPSHVFKRDLLNTSLVSKKLRELALDPVLWTELEFSDHRKRPRYKEARCRGRDLPSLQKKYICPDLTVVVVVACNQPLS